MNEHEDRNNIIDQLSDIEEDLNSVEEMDPEEAAVVAKVMAKLLVAAEVREAKAAEAAPEHHALTEEELLANEAAEQAAKRSFGGRLRSVFRRIFSILTPNNKKLAVPALIAEILVLAALVVILGRYSHVAPETPTQYSNPKTADSVSCRDGLLMVNGVRVKVPDEGNVKYSISYAWAETDTDYPSVPHAIVATYIEPEQEAASPEDTTIPEAEQEGGDKIVDADQLRESEEENESDKSSDEDKKADPAKDSAQEEDAGAQADVQEGTIEDSTVEGKTLYEISLYKDSFTPKEQIPKGKNEKNWFADWTTEKSDNVYKFPHKVGKIRGFCISTLDVKVAAADYRTYTYYFAVPENKGISVYVVEGLCYDHASMEAFNTIIKNAINSIEVNQEDA